MDEYEHQYYGDKLAGNVPYRDIRILLKSRIKPCNAQGVEYNRNAGYGEQRFVLIEPVNGKEQYKKYSVCYCRGDKVYYYKFLCGFCELFAVIANSCARADHYEVELNRMHLNIFLCFVLHIKTPIR